MKIALDYIFKKTKQLLQKLLEKLEDNFEYQLFLGNYNKPITTCEIEVDIKLIEEKDNETPIQAVIKNKDVSSFSIVYRFYNLFKYLL